MGGWACVGGWFGRRARVPARSLRLAPPSPTARPPPPLLLLPHAQVVDLISLKPFDMETISKSIKKTRRAIIVEECMKVGGSGWEGGGAWVGGCRCALSSWRSA